MEEYQFMAFKNGVPALLSPDELKAVLGTMPAPTEEKPTPERANVFGHPRMLEGTDAEGHSVFSSKSFPYLLVQIGNIPDVFVPKGTNYNYTSPTGAVRQTGADTEWYGNATPKDFVQPKGYRKGYFKDKDGKPMPDQAFYVQSDEADEVLPGKEGNGAPVINNKLSTVAAVDVATSKLITS